MATTREDSGRGFERLVDERLKAQNAAHARSSSTMVGGGILKMQELLFKTFAVHRGMSLLEKVCVISVSV